jgi:hypothetical protein
LPAAAVPVSGTFLTRAPTPAIHFAQTVSASRYRAFARLTERFRPVNRALPIRRRSSQLRGGEAEHVAPIYLDYGIEAGRVRLPHAPKSRFGQFNRPIIMGDEIQAGVE